MQLFGSALLLMLKSIAGCPQAFYNDGIDHSSVTNTALR
jgi:hypothetical protein